MANKHTIGYCESIEILSTWTNTNFPGKTLKIVRHPKFGICISDDRNGILGMKLDSWIDYENTLHVTGWIKQIPK